MHEWTIRILDSPEDIQALVALQRLVWPGSDIEVIPAHLLLTVAHNGGLVIGAFQGQSRPFEQPDIQTVSLLGGFVFGFPGFYHTPDGPRLKHCSHMLGVHPDFRNSGLGFRLKRAQWQMVRHQGLDRITWTYDPLLSRNAGLNINRLGGVCNTYLEDEYGPLDDDLNRGLASDRFQVDWWINTQRVVHRLSKTPRPRLDLSNFIAAGAEIVNPGRIGANGWLHPPDEFQVTQVVNRQARPEASKGSDAVLLVEIPADFQALKAADRQLALAWRQHTQMLFQELFTRGYIITDFVYLPAAQPRSFYVLSYGESTL